MLRWLGALLLVAGVEVILWVAWLASHGHECDADCSLLQDATYWAMIWWVPAAVLAFVVFTVFKRRTSQS